MKSTPAPTQSLLAFLAFSGGQFGQFDTGAAGGLIGEQTHACPVTGHAGVVECIKPVIVFVDAFPAGDHPFARHEFFCLLLSRQGSGVWPDSGARAAGPGTTAMPPVD